MTVKRKATQRSKEKWLEIIKAYKDSRKSLKIWCQENGVAISSYHSAYKRLFPNEKQATQEQLILKRSYFHELKENKSSHEIEINFKNIAIKIPQNFDENLLLNLLKVLEKL